VAEWLEGDGAEGKLMQREPTWTTARGTRLGSICWLEHLLQSNRERLYVQVVDAVLQRVSACTALAEPRENTNLVPFRIIRMAGDGRCGWRSLLAALDPDAHELVPRTPWCVLASYI